MELPLERVRDWFETGRLVEAYEGLARGTPRLRLLEDYLLAAAVLRAGGRERRRRALLKLAADRFPDQLEAVLARADDRRQRGKLLEAEAILLERASLSGPGERARLDASLALVFVQMARIGRALELSQCALQAAPSDVEVLYDCAWVALVAARFEESLGHYRRVVELQPARARAWTLMAEASWRLGRPEEALSLLDSAPVFVRQDFTAAAHRAEVLRDLGRHAEAAEAARATVELWPRADYAPYLNDLRARCLYECGDRAALAELLEGCPGDGLAERWKRALEAEPRQVRVAMRHQTQRYNACYPTSISMIASALDGGYRDPEQFAPGVPFPQSILEELETVLGECQLAVRHVMPDAVTLKTCCAAGFPVLVGMPGIFEGHAIAVAGFDETLESLLIHDPAMTGPAWIPQTVADEHWTTVGHWAVAIAPAACSEALGALSLRDNADAAHAIELRRMRREGGRPRSEAARLFGLAHEFLPEKLVYQALLAARPSTSFERFQTAHAAVSMGDGDRALSLASGRLDDGSKAYLEAMTLWGRSTPKKAHEAAVRAVSLLPGQKLAWILRGRTAFGAGDFTDARKCASIALEQDPGSIEALELLGHASQALGEAHEGRRLRAELTRIARRSPRAWSARASVAAMAGKGREAWRCFRVAMALSAPGDGQATIDAAAHALDTGRPDLALRLLEPLVRSTAPDEHGGLHLLYADARLQQGDVDGALEAVRPFEGAGWPPHVLRRAARLRCSVAFSLSDYEECLRQAGLADGGAPAERLDTVRFALMVASRLEDLAGVDAALELLGAVAGEGVEPIDWTAHVPIEALSRRALARVSKWLVSRGNKAGRGEALLLTRVQSARNLGGPALEGQLRLLRADPSDAAVLAALSETCAGLERPDDARWLLEEAFRQSGRPGGPGFAEMLSARGDHESAARVLAESARRRPLDESIAGALVDELNACGRQAEAEAWLAGRRGWLSDAFLEEQEVLRRHQSGAERPELPEVAELARRNPWRPISRGLWLERVVEDGAEKHAGELELRAVRCPHVAHIWATLGLARHRLGDRAGAVAAHRKAYVLVGAWSQNVARLLQGVGEQGPVLPLLRELADGCANLDEMRDLVELTWTLLDARTDSRRRVELLNRYLELDPEWWEGKAMLSITGGDQDGPDPAKLAADAARSQEESWYCQAMHGLHLLGRNADQAAIAFQRARALKPLPFVIARLGEAHLYAGRPLAARRAFDEALAADRWSLEAAERRLCHGAPPVLAAAIGDELLRADRLQGLSDALPAWLRARWLLGRSVPREAYEVLEGRLGWLHRLEGAPFEQKRIFETALHDIHFNEGTLMPISTVSPWTLPWFLFRCIFFWLQRGEAPIRSGPWPLEASSIVREVRALRCRAAARELPPVPRPPLRGARRWPFGTALARRLWQSGKACEAEIQEVEILPWHQNLQGTLAYELKLTWTFGSGRTGSCQRASVVEELLPYVDVPLAPGEKVTALYDADDSVLLEASGLTPDLDPIRVDDALRQRRRLVAAAMFGPLASFVALGLILGLPEQEPTASFALWAVLLSALTAQGMVSWAAIRYGPIFYDWTGAPRGAVAVAMVFLTVSFVFLAWIVAGALG